jgi:hypothetical protein
MYKNILCSYNHKQAQNISMLPDIKCPLRFPFLCHFYCTYASQFVADGSVWHQLKDGGYLATQRMQSIAIKFQAFINHYNSPLGS